MPEKKQGYFINISKGQEFIDTETFAFLIADAVTPQNENPLGLIGLHKIIVSERSTRIEPCDTNDKRLLDEVIWSECKSRPVLGETSRYEFQAFANVFNNSPHKPEWELYPLFRSRLASVGQSSAHRQHCDLLNAAVKSGELQVLSEFNVPVKTVESGSFISVANARAYLVKLGIDLIETNQSIATEEPWIVFCRAQIDDIFQARIASCKECTKSYLADELVGRCRKAKYITKRNNPVAKDNVLKRVLADWVVPEIE